MLIKLIMISPLMILLIAQQGIITKDRIKIVEQFSSSAQQKQRIANWEEKSFVEHTQYSIVDENGNFVLHAWADSSASGLYKKIKYSVRDWPYLSWRWKVTRIPKKGDVRQKSTDDYAARVYVVFPKFLKWKTKTITYIWANRLSKGESVPNAWLPQNVMMIALESGEENLGEWIAEKRNVYKDYKNAFKEDPPTAGAIALMTDADNTGEISEAFYDDFMMER